MYSDLLLAVTGHGDDEAAFAAACALAQPQRGHVTVLVQARVPMVDTGEAFGVFPMEAYVALRDRLLAEGEEAASRWRGALARAGVAGELRFALDAWESPAILAARHAHRAEMALVGLAPAGTLPFAVHDHAARLLCEGGRPLLAVPHGAAPFAATRVVVAWKPCAHAARAVHDALPWLARASAVTVACVDPDADGDALDDAAGAGICAHLARLGVQATVRALASGGAEPGEILLQACRDADAGLLVMGGYGHSRLREWVLGSTTRHVLRHAQVPVLLSH